MKFIFVFIVGVLLLNVSVMAQQTDSASNKSNTMQQGPQPAVNPAGTTEKKEKRNTSQSSATYQGNPVPRGESQILDGTNAIPIDSSDEKNPSRDQADRPRRKSKQN